MKKLIVILSCVIFALLATAVIFYACRKDTNLQGSSIKSHKSMAYCDKQLVKQFMEEPLIDE
jgi:hypothetical protein